MARIPVVRYVAPVGSSNPNGAAIASTQPMRGPALPREQFPVRAMNRTQSAARQATVQATSSDDASCTVIRGWRFVALTPYAIPHGLTDEKGRPKYWASYRIENVQGGFARFVAVPQGAGGVIGGADIATIVIESDAGCTADVRVW